MMEKQKFPVTFRAATAADTALILRFIRALAEYEHMSDDVVADEATLAEWLFDKKKASVLFAVDADGKEVGFALYFYNFSTFLGRAGVYLEDLFVLESERGKGYGKALLLKLKELAEAEGCGRLEWSCLDWNQPSIAFYKALGAVSMDDWTTYRMKLV